MIRFIYYRRAVWVAAAVLSLTVAAVAVPAFYAMIFIGRSGYPYIAEPSLLGLSLVKTTAFALPSATMQTLIGFLAALFVTSYLKGQSAIGYRITLALDVFLTLPYLVPSVAWFWFTIDREITTIKLLDNFPSGYSVLLEKIAEVIDVHLIAIAHLVPFTYLVARLFFDHLRSDHIHILEQQLGSRFKAVLLMGGRPLLELVSGVFLLRLLITANKYDLPYIGSKGYEQIRPESWIFTLPLWLDYIFGIESSPLSIAAVLSLTIVGSFVSVIGISLLIRYCVASSFLDSRIDNLCGAVLSKVKNCGTRVLGLSAVLAFIWMACSALFVVWSMARYSSIESFHILMEIPIFKNGLVLCSILITLLAVVTSLFVPICRIVHLLSEGWGTTLTFQVIRVFLVLPPLLLAISCRLIPKVRTPLTYFALLFVITFPFVYLQVKAVWKRQTAATLAAALRTKSALALVFQHLRGGNLRDYTVTSFTVVYVVVTNEIACAQLLLPDDLRPINYALLRIKPMFDSNINIQATAPLVVVLSGVSILLPLYFFTRSKKEDLERI